MPREFGLETIQRWLQNVVTAPGDVHDALASPGARDVIAPDEVGDVVRPSWSLTAEERVGVYHGMYMMRMVEALETDYPALKHHLGDDAFERLVEAYVACHPSRSYTLNRLGDHLPAFLIARGDAFLHDLARTELAITESFDAEEIAPLDQGQIERIAPGAWETARLSPVPSLRVVELSYAVGPHLDAAKAAVEGPRPRRRRTFLAIHRKDYSVTRHVLTRGEHALLAALAGGVPLAGALESAAPQFRAKDREERIFRCFRRWIAAGFFAAVR